MDLAVRVVPCIFCFFKKIKICIAPVDSMIVMMENIDGMFCS